MKPFLLQFAEEAGSPPVSELGTEYYFDSEDDILRLRRDPDNPPAIDGNGRDPPRTKKNDVEKGEDNKDREMWL